MTDSTKYNIMYTRQATSISRMTGCQIMQICWSSVKHIGTCLVCVQVKFVRFVSDVLLTIFKIWQEQVDNCTWTSYDWSSEHDQPWELWSTNFKTSAWLDPRCPAPAEVQTSPCQLPSPLNGMPSNLIQFNLISYESSMTKYNVKSF
jgi:hypothetical protein